MVPRRMEKQTASEREVETEEDKRRKRTLSSEGANVNRITNTSYILIEILIVHINIGAKIRKTNK